MISNVSVPLVGIVDTAVVGHLEHPYYLGAVAIGALIFTFLFWGFSFLRMGTTGLTAQALGAGRRDDIVAIPARGLMFAAAFGLALLALQSPVGWAAFALLNASAEAEAHAATYFAVRIWAAPAVLANYVILGWLLGMQRAGIALAVQLILNMTNIVLDVLFVLGLGLGVAGVALASVIAEIAALAAGLTWLALLLRRRGARWPGRALGDWPAMRRLLAVNRDIFIRTICLITAFAWFTGTGAAMGDVVLAANAVLLNFQTFMAFALDGYADACAALVGETIGAGNRRRFERSVVTALIWAAATAALFSAIYWLAGGLMIDTMTGIDAVREAARRFLPWSILLPMVSFWCFLLDGIFIGATRTRAMRDAMVLSLAAYLVVAWAAVESHGNHGLWFAFVFFMAMRALTLGAALPQLTRSLAAPSAAA